eukprot:1151693-Pelagomonas_calceolata.AAC.8
MSPSSGIASESLQALLSSMHCMRKQQPHCTSLDFWAWQHAQDYCCMGPLCVGSALAVHLSGSEWVPGGRKVQKLEESLRGYTGHNPRLLQQAFNGLALYPRGIAVRGSTFILSSFVQSFQNGTALQHCSENCNRFHLSSLCDCALFAHQRNMCAPMHVAAVGCHCSLFVCTHFNVDPMLSHHASRQQQGAANACATVLLLLVRLLGQAALLLPHTLTARH